MVGSSACHLSAGCLLPIKVYFSDAGLYTKGNTNMVVSQGLENSIIPIRFNNRPEIVVIEIFNIDL